MRFSNSLRKMAKLHVFANSEDPDQTLHSVASDLGLHCFRGLLTLGDSFWVCTFYGLTTMG